MSADAKEAMGAGWLVKTPEGRCLTLGMVQGDTDVWAMKMAQALALATDTAAGGVTGVRKSPSIGRAVTASMIKRGGAPRR